MYNHENKAQVRVLFPLNMVLGREVDHQTLRTASDSAFQTEFQGNFFPTPGCQDKVLSLDNDDPGTLTGGESSRAICVYRNRNASEKIYTAMPCWGFKSRVMSGRPRRHIADVRRRELSVRKEKTGHY